MVRAPGTRRKRNQRGAGGGHDYRRQARDRLDDHLRGVVAAFEERYPAAAKCPS